MGYSVRPPYASYGESVGKQISSNERKGFSASMERLGEALQPYALQRKRQRFAEQVQEDRQAHDFDLAAKRFQNQKDLAEFTFSEELKNLEKKREMEQDWRRDTQASISKAMKELGETSDQFYSRSGAEIAAQIGVPVEEAEQYVKSFRAAQEFEEKRENAKRDKKTDALNQEAARLRLRTLAQERAEQLARMKLLPLSKQLAQEGRAAEIALEKEENALKLQTVAVNGAQKKADREASTSELKRSTAELQNSLARANLESAEVERLTAAGSKAAERSLALIESYDEDLKKLEEEILDMPDGIKKKSLIAKANGLVEARNRQARAIGHPIEYWDTELNISMTNANATQERFDDERGIAEFAKKTADPTVLVASLLNTLPLEAIDTYFLTMFPRAMDLAKKEPSYVARGLQHYHMIHERIINERKKAAAAAAARNAPTTDGENTGPPPPPAPSPAPSASGGGFWGEGF